MKLKKRLHRFRETSAHIQKQNTSLSFWFPPNFISKRMKLEERLHWFRERYRETEWTKVPIFRSGFRQSNRCNASRTTMVYWIDLKIACPLKQYYSWQILKNNNLQGGWLTGGFLSGGNGTIFWEICVVNWCWCCLSPDAWPLLAPFSVCRFAPLMSLNSPLDFWTFWGLLLRLPIYIDIH